VAALLASTYFSGSLLAAYNFIALAATATALIAIAMTCLALVALVRREPEMFPPAARVRAPFFAVVGLGVVAILLRGSGVEIWAFTIAVILLPIPFYFWSRRGAKAQP